MKKMIYHVPFPLNRQARSASGIRPVKMLDAFKAIGYEVYLISGYAAERKKKIISLMNDNSEYDFLYSESSTMPTALTEKHHIPTHPFLDFNLFKWCNKKNIKIGLFYRDIYWKFALYGEQLPFYKKEMAKFFYRYDLKNYNRLVEKLYLPSNKMADFLPEIDSDIIGELPPASDAITLGNINTRANDEINILYIGGLGEHYKMHVMFAVVSKLENVSLTICTRENEWLDVKHEYDEYLNNSINIVHKSGEELVDLFLKSHITTIFVEVSEYRTFAVPVKIFEYLSYEKPIIASRGSMAAEFVENNNIGWSIDYQEDTLLSLINKIRSDESILLNKNEHMKNVKKLNLWTSRAKQVQKDLSA